MEYENPVLPGFHPDPSVCRVGEDYYLATSTFEYFPGLALFHSRNLVDWEPIGHALTREEQLPLEDVDSSGGIFAPTLRYHEGTFYLITTNVSADGHFVVTADDPAGEWSDPTWLDAPGIDPDLFWDDGECYVTYCADGIHQATIDLETGELGESRLLLERLAAGYTEAPHLYEVDGVYYLVLAEGGTHVNHMVTVARADDPTGPFYGYEDNPVLSHRDVGSDTNPIQATGHGDLVRAHDGSWWIVFLGIRVHGGYPGWHHLGRETFLAPVTWEDGWPVVDGGEFVESEMRVPDTDLERVPEPRTWETVQPFADGTLGSEWNYRGNPDRGRYAVSDGALEVTPGPAPLDDPTPTFVGRRQQHLECTAEARLSFDPGPSAEAGLTVLANHGHHYDLGVTRRDGSRVAFLRLRIGDASSVVSETTLAEGPVDLSVDADAEQYRFSAGPAGEEPESLGSAATRYVSTEVAGGFTGAYVGCYASDSEGGSERTARFERFEYRPTN